MALNFANNNSLSAITTKPSGLSGGALNLISTQTASSSSTISFTSGIDSTYDEYVFKFYDIHPASDNVTFQVGFRDGSTAYDATKTTTFFRAYHDEGDSATALEYQTGKDLAQGTGFQPIIIDMGTDNDQSGCFRLHLFDPSSTTFVKNFTSTMQNYHNADLSNQLYVGGYCNVTAAIDGVQFKMSSGNIDAGTIKMYGVN